MIETTLKEWTMPDSYFGETWEGWLIGPVAHHRDSELLTESNWAYQLKALEPLATDLEDADIETLGGEPINGKSVMVVSESHWAVGWIEWLAIHPSNVEAVRAAEAIQGRLDAYPVLDEDDWSMREDEAAQEIWKDCYNNRDRIEYVREHWTQFDFQDLADLIAVCRGRYFSGYACELLN